MARGDLSDVQKCLDHIVFIDRNVWNLIANNFTKNAIVHALTSFLLVLLLIGTLISCYHIPN